jgi:hypothetical protein
MSSQQAIDFTYRRIIPYDNLLNWVLTALLIFFPEMVGRLITTVPVLPTIVYSVTGIGFGFFAIWQDWVLIRKRQERVDLWIAATLAFAPAIILIVPLILFAPVVRPIWLALLWGGEIYMIILGLWYVRIAQLLIRPE